MTEFPKNQEVLEPTEGFDLTELGRALWRRKGIIFGTVIIGLALAIPIIFQLTPLYKAETFVLIDPRKNQAINMEAVLSGLSNDQATIESEIQVIRSRYIASKTIDKLKLAQYPEYNGALRQPGMAQLLDPRNYLPNIFTIYLRKDIVKEETEDQLKIGMINTLLANLNVRSVGRSRVIRIAFTSKTPKTAALVANTVADFYIVSQLEAKFEATRRANKWLSERLIELSQQVEDTEKAVEAFRGKSGLIEEGKGGTLAAQDLSEVNSQLIQAQVKRTAAVARLQEVERQLESGNSMGTVGEVLQSPLIQALRAQEADLAQRVAELTADFGDRHPKMINARAQLEAMGIKIKTEASKIIMGLRNEVSFTRSSEAALRATVSRLKIEMGQFKRASVQLRALEREANATRTLFETFLLRFKETTTQEKFQEPDASIISDAYAPKIPFYPKKKTLLSMSFVGSLMLGLVLAFVIERLDHGFRSMEQLEKFLNISALGLVPFIETRKRGNAEPASYILDKPASAFGESLRSLYTSLMFSDLDHQPKTILITSSLPGEGKTSVSVTLARLLASAGKKIIIIDADLRRPTVARLFQSKTKLGLVDFLLDRAPINEVIQIDPKSGAYFLPAGSSVPNPADLLGSTQMKLLLEKLAGSYDLVIIDSAPVLAVSDTIVLSHLVDKTVFIVRWIDTRREVAAGGLRQLVDTGANVAGVLLTMVDVKKHAGYGYSDSGYYYGRTEKYYRN